MLKYTVSVTALLCLAFTACQKELINNSNASLSVSKPASGGGPTGPLPTIATWNTLQNLPFNGWNSANPTIGDEGPLGFAINGKGYVCGSLLFASDGQIKSVGSVWEYDNTNSTWTKKATTSTIFDAAASFVIGNDAYVLPSFGGSTYRYDQPTNTWTTTLAPFPGFPGRYNLTAISINGKGYVGLGGGIGSDDHYHTYSDWYEYNPATNQWTKKGDFPGGARAGAAAFTIDGKGYVCSGYSSPGDVWQYDATSDTWTPKANLPVSNVVGKGLDGIVNKGHHYGFIVSSGANGCLQYDPTTDQWVVLQTMPGGDRQGFAAFMVNRAIVVGGGTNATTSNPRMDVRQLSWNQ